jgi:hypothetical protein
LLSGHVAEASPAFASAHACWRSPHQPGRPSCSRPAAARVLCVASPSPDPAAGTCPSRLGSVHFSSFSRFQGASPARRAYARRRTAHANGRIGCAVWTPDTPQPPRPPPPTFPPPHPSRLSVPGLLYRARVCMHILAAHTPLNTPACWRHPHRGPANDGDASPSSLAPIQPQPQLGRARWLALPRHAHNLPAWPARRAEARRGHGCAAPAAPSRLAPPRLPALLPHLWFALTPRPLNPSHTKPCPLRRRPCAPPPARHRRHPLMRAWRLGLAAICMPPVSHPRRPCPFLTRLLRSRGQSKWGAACAALCVAPPPVSSLRAVFTYKLASLQPISI